MHKHAGACQYGQVSDARSSHHMGKLKSKQRTHAQHWMGVPHAQPLLCYLQKAFELLSWHLGRVTPGEVM